MGTTWTIATDASGFMPAGMAQMLLVIMVVGVGVLLTISIRLKIARKNAAIPSARDQIEAIKAGGNARADADAIQASMHDFARKLSAQLDNKAERLEQLIVQAEDRIAQLNALESQASGAATAKPFTRKVISNGPPMRTPASEATSSAKGQALSVSTRSESEPADSLRRAIYALADSGRTPVEISRELDEHIGKIELILALRHG